MDDKFKKPYEPTETEGRIYEMWEKSGYFSPDVCVEKGAVASDAPTYSIVLPPPNVTGRLHMGHALMLAIEDTFVRFKRMRGFRTLWVPGTDHAAIATQSVVEKEISKKEGKSRHDLGREELLRRVGEFAEQSHDTIVSQLKTMGASLDWSREAFTLDETRTRAVRTVFKQMYDAGLIYRGNRIVNWDPKGQTTISDDEIVYEERASKLYTFRYSKDFPIAVATTRLETKVGDTAVAVHPDDARYKHLIGTEYDVTFCDVPLHLKIVGDESVDPAFGTGALGVTPAHSVIDWEIADRHNLPRPQVINEYAKMIAPGSRIDGMKVTDAREAVVTWLREEGLLEAEEDIRQNVSTAERTGGIIEPLPKLQWFIDVTKEIPGRGKSLKQLMLEPVKNGDITFVPEHFDKTYYHWIENLRDWCISRQIWYGHRVPVWYKRALGGPNQAKHFNLESFYELLGVASEQEFRAKIEELGNADYAQSGGSPNIQIGISLLTELRDRNLITDDWISKHEVRQAVWSNEEIFVGLEAPNEPGWEQDPDTLDTWFSSGLWTFSTLGWPEKTPEFETYHPTDMIETGYDILFFWVARMILMTGFALDTIPFRTIYLHGLVRDAQGRKMSKSLGNNMDPLDIAAKYGADAARMALIVGNTPGTDMRISEDKIKGYKHFGNKLWNITRFILENASDADASATIADRDHELFANLAHLGAEVTKDIEEFRIYMAAEKLYHYTWHELADVILEESKTIFAGDDTALIASRKLFLMNTLGSLLKMLHPFMPFITEEIYQSLPQKDAECLMIAEWPSAN